MVSHMSHQEAMERFGVMTRDLEALVTQLPVSSLAGLPMNHDVRYIIRNMLNLASDATDRQRTPLLISQKIVQLLYKTPSPLRREVYVGLLDQLCQQFEDVAKEAITWLLYAEDEVLFIVTMSLTTANFLCSENSTFPLLLFYSVAVLSISSCKISNLPR